MMSWLTMPILPSVLLAAESADAWRLTWNWQWPLWFTAVLAATAIAWVTTIYFRETSSAGRPMRIVLSILRLTAFALAMLMFAQPAIERLRTEQPRLVVLVDRSRSMQIEDKYPGKSREMTRLQGWQELLTAAEQPLIDQWQNDYRLDVVSFDGEIERLEMSDASIAEQLRTIRASESLTTGTRLGEAIDFALRELPGPLPAAVVVLSDGIATAGPSLRKAAELARRLRVPLHTVAIGTDQRRTDVAIDNMIVEEIVFPGDRLQVEATVRATGYAGQSAEVRLSDGAGEVLASTTITLPADDANKTVSLAVRPSTVGQIDLQLSIDPLDGEQTAENNRVAQSVEVRDEKIRVLLVDSQPSFEYRALKSLLERDPAIQLSALLQEADADYVLVDDVAIRSFPSDEAKLFDFDVLIVGDVDPSLLPRSTWPRIERFVGEHGGGLVAIAGPRFMPFAYRNVPSLAGLMPMELAGLNPLRSQLNAVQAMSVLPTELGWRASSLQLGDTPAQTRQVWQALPPLMWLIRLDDVKPGAQVLAVCSEFSNRQGQSAPVILRHYVGAGEVLFHATDETWRWRWRTDDRYFARYWGQVVRRLGRGRLAAGRQGVQLSTDRSNYQPGEPVQIYARFRNPANAPASSDEVVLQLQGQSGPLRQIALQRRFGRRGLFSATVEGLQPDRYEVRMIRPDRADADNGASFDIRQPSRELAEVAVNATGLREAAEITGGKFYSITDTSQLSEQLPSPSQQTRDHSSAKPLWNSNAILGIFVGVLASEWIFRCRYGML